MIVSARNKLLNWLVGSKNSIVEINFDVKGRTFKAYVPDDQYWGSIKDVPITAAAYPMASVIMIFILNLYFVP